MVMMVRLRLLYLFVSLTAFVSGAQSQPHDYNSNSWINIQTEKHLSIDEQSPDEDDRQAMQNLHRNPHEVQVSIFIIIIIIFLTSFYIELLLYFEWAARG